MTDILEQTDNRENLFGKTLPELEEISRRFGMPRFSAAQIASWLYRKGAGEISLMTDISLKNRSLLEKEYYVGVVPPLSVSVSADGTKKYLFATRNGNEIESVYIPESDRATLCVSSQAGCRMGCAFCMTGRQGLRQNLTAGEIVNQVRSLPEAGVLSNIVYMGMGEPMDNLEEVLKSLDIMTAGWGFGWSPSRITVSTVGILPALEEFLRRSRVRLAISLHSPFGSERSRMVPAEKAYPISEIIRVLKNFDKDNRRISFEYIVFKGINDTGRHVAELARLLGGMSCRLNLIRFHAIPDSPFESPDQAGMERFRDALSRKGIVTTIRASRGEDIMAACGLLSTAARTPPRNGAAEPESFIEE